MAVVKVYIPTPFRGLTAGQGHVSGEGRTIADLIEDLDRRYPGLAARICSGSTVHHHVNVFVNGQEMRSLRGEATVLSDGDEVAFVPALVGGNVRAEPRWAEPPWCNGPGFTGLGRMERSDVIEITQAHYEEIVTHAREDFPNECCGLLFGTGTRALVLRRMENVEHSPLNYRVDSQKLLEAFQEMEERGLDLVGIYHSHTHSPAEPSRTDIALAGYPDAHYLIVSLADPAQPVLRAFLIDRGVVTPQPITITANPTTPAATTPGCRVR